MLLSSEIWGPFLLATASGCATMIGAVAAVLHPPGRRLLAASLGFAGGIMLTVSLTDLLPQAVQAAGVGLSAGMGALAVTTSCLAGMLLGLCLDVFLPEEKTGESSLWRLGLFSMLAMLLHNLPEGMAVFLSGCTDLRLGSSMAMAIALHNIPEGVMVALPVMAAKGSRRKALGMSALSALAEPLGALLAWGLLAPYITVGGLGLLYAAIAGLMLYITAAQLLPAAFHRGRISAMGGILLGILTMYGGLLLL